MGLDQVHTSMFCFWKIWERTGGSIPFMDSSSTKSQTTEFKAKHNYLLWWIFSIWPWIHFPLSYTLLGVPEGWHLRTPSVVSLDLWLPGVALKSCATTIVTVWTITYQAALFYTISWSLPKFVSIESVIPCNQVIVCCLLLLLPSTFPSIRVFSNGSALRIKWPKC